MSFTHGANDVSNAMGPFSAVYTIWRDGEISKSVTVDTWILVVGGSLTPTSPVDLASAAPHP